MDPADVARLRPPDIPPRSYATVVAETKRGLYTRMTEAPLEATSNVVGPGKSERRGAILSGKLKTTDGLVSDFEWQRDSCVVAGLSGDSSAALHHKPIVSSMQGHRQVDSNIAVSSLLVEGSNQLVHDSFVGPAMAGSRKPTKEKHAVDQAEDSQVNTSKADYVVMEEREVSHNNVLSELLEYRVPFFLTDLKRVQIAQGEEWFTLDVKWSEVLGLSVKAKVDLQRIIDALFIFVKANGTMSPMLIERAMEEWAGKHDLNDYIRKEALALVSGIFFPLGITRQADEKMKEVHSDATDDSMAEDNAGNPRDEGSEKSKQPSLLKANAFVDEKELKAAEVWWSKHAIVGHLQGAPPPRLVLNNWIDNAWNKRGLTVTNVRLLKKGYMLIVFDTPLMVDIVLSHGLWTIRNQPLYVERWSVAFSPDKPRPTLAPVWVELTDLPIIFYSQLDDLCGSLGKVMCLEPDAYFNPRGSPQVCVLMDLALELPQVLSIRRQDGTLLLDQQLVYKNLPNSCFLCGRAGHRVRDCPSKRSRVLPKVQSKWVPKKGGSKENKSDPREGDSKDDQFSTPKRSQAVPKGKAQFHEVKFSNPFDVLGDDSNIDDSELKSNQEEAVPSVEMHTSNILSGVGQVDAEPSKGTTGGEVSLAGQLPPEFNKYDKKRRQSMGLRSSLVNFLPKEKRQSVDEEEGYFLDEGVFMERGSSPSKNWKDALRDEVNEKDENFFSLSMKENEDLD